jgi:hypothetical protein
MMQCTYCGVPYHGVRTQTGEQVCSHCGEPLRLQPWSEERTEAPATDEGIDLETAQKVRIPERYSIPWLLVELGLALVGLVVTLLLGAGALYIATSGIVVICALVGLLMTGILYRRSRAAIDSMLIGEVRVIHWTYNERDWQQFTGQSWLWPALLGSLGFVGCLLLATLIVTNASGTEYTGSIFIGLGAILVTFLLPSILEGVIVRRSQRRLRSGDTYISIAGIILGGWCISSLSNLDRVSYEDGYPAVLRFYTHAYGQYTRTTSSTEVRVPRGCEEQAKQLALNYSQKAAF